MEEAQLFDACIKEVEIFSRKVSNRQSYQWKITLGLWALIGAAVSFLWGKIAPPYWVVWLVLLPYAFFWVRPVAVKNHDDQELEWYFIRKSWSVLSIMTEDAALPLKTQLWSCQGLFGFLCNWAHFFECIATGVILHLGYWLLSTAAQARPH